MAFHHKSKRNPRPESAINPAVHRGFTFSLFRAKHRGVVTYVRSQPLNTERPDLMNKLDKQCPNLEGGAQILTKPFSSGLTQRPTDALQSELSVKLLYKDEIVIEPLKPTEHDVCPVEVSPCDTTSETEKAPGLISFSGARRRPTDDLQAFISSQTDLRTERSTKSEEYGRCSAPPSTPVTETLALESMTENVLLEASKALEAVQISLEATKDAPGISEQGITCVAPQIMPHSEDDDMDKCLTLNLVEDQVSHVSPQEDGSKDCAHLAASPKAEAMTPKSENKVCYAGSTDPKSISGDDMTLLQDGPDSNIISAPSMSEKPSVEVASPVAASSKLDAEVIATKIEEEAIPDIMERSIFKTSTEGSISVDENPPRTAGDVSLANEGKVEKLPVLVEETLAEENANTVAISPKLDAEVAATKIEEEAMPDIMERTIFKTPTEGSTRVDGNLPRTAGDVSPIEGGEIDKLPILEGDILAEEGADAVAISPKLDAEVTATKIEEEAILDRIEKLIFQTPTEGSISVDNNSPRTAGDVSPVEECKNDNLPTPACKADKPPVQVGEMLQLLLSDSKQTENPVDERKVGSKRRASEEHLKCLAPSSPDGAMNANKLAKNDQSEGQSIDALAQSLENTEAALFDYHTWLENLPQVPCTELRNESSVENMLLSPDSSSPSKLNEISDTIGQSTQPEDLAQPFMEACSASAPSMTDSQKVLANKSSCDAPTFSQKPPGWGTMERQGREVKLVSHTLNPMA